MAIINQDSQPFEPYARLMNIIGDQLITDKKVAVIEIIKNCYDADAENVQVRFFNMSNYGKSYLDEKDMPYIEIEDDGDGMTLDIIRKVWLRPATPSKLDKKKLKQNRTLKGRIIQGEKGIGRFAIHKLGEKIELFTKAFCNDEVKLVMDFTEFNPEKIDLFNQPPTEYKLLNKVNNDWYVNVPPEEIRNTKGTLIRIFHLRELWYENELIELYKSIQRLIPPIDENAEELGINFKQDFNIQLFNDNRIFSSEDVTTFRDVIERAQFTMIGTVSDEGILDFKYKSSSPVRSFSKKVNMLSKEDMSDNNYSSYAIEHWFAKNNRKPKCGQFKFTFYAFDLHKGDKTILTKDVEKFIKENFVFVLRDGVRVYPYGEKGIDWLNLDKLRSTVKAGQFISYNDLTGFVYITQAENPKLKDSTNRQGMMDIDNSLEDFKSLITAVTEVLNSEMKIDKAKLELFKEENIKQSANIVTKAFNTLKTSLERTNNIEVIENANKFLDLVQNHSNTMKDRLETVEDLAGLGMAVEKASHDSLMVLSKMRSNIKDFKTKVKNEDFNNNELLFLLNELDDNLEFVYNDLQIIQPLYKNQRKAIQDVSVFETIEKVVNYFRRDIKGKIDVKIIKDSDVFVKTNSGIILQIIINILDNAIYWVNKNETKDKEIIFKINTKNNSLTISDNGPGIREDIVPLIFSEFFSLKSDGRGLGLYIVKEILLRINGEIYLVQEPNKKLLPGANFIIKFNQEQ